MSLERGIGFQIIPRLFLLSLLLKTSLLEALWMLLVHFALPPQQWQLLAGLGAASLSPGDYTESWLPAGPFRHLSATAEIIAVNLIVPAG